MRNSSILKWANNKNSGSSKLGGGAKNGEKKWIHSPDTLVQGHVVYLVKVNHHLCVGVTVWSGLSMFIHFFKFPNIS